MVPFRTSIFHHSINFFFFIFSDSPQREKSILGIGKLMQICLSKHTVILDEVKGQEGLRDGLPQTGNSQTAKKEDEQGTSFHLPSVRIVTQCSSEPELLGS